jgi:hypothetical protein
LSAAYTFPLNKGQKLPPEPKKHIIEDIHFTKPFFVECLCGWKETGRSSQDIEQAWKAHKANPDLEIEEELTA